MIKAEWTSTDALDLQPTCNQLATDCISRQAAIDALIAEGRNVDSRYLESERIIHESDAVEAISLLPSAPRWIPVSERLPKPVAPSQRREWFITSNTYGGVTVTCYEFEASPFKEGWQTDMTILAWMPLPEPWKGE